MSLAESIHINSLDRDNRRFVPDEVFETAEEALETIEFLIVQKDRIYIGYVQAAPLEDGTWEIGYHIGSDYTKQGYATKAVTAFLPNYNEADRYYRDCEYLPCRKQVIRQSNGTLRI